MIAPVCHEDLVGARAHGHTREIIAQLAYTNHRRRVQHAQHGALHRQHLHAMQISDHQRPRRRQGNGVGVGEPTKRITNVFQQSAITQSPKRQSMVVTVGNHDYRPLLVEG